SALVPFMSDLKPPSQNRPGAAPSRRRTAIPRAAIPVPTFKNFRQRSLIWGTRLWAHGFVGRVSPPAAIEYKDARAANKPTRVEGMASVSNDDSHAHPRTLASATVLQIVPVLREEPVARAALDVASALVESGARALVAAEEGPLVAELTAFGGEWVPLANATVNPFKLRRGARILGRLIASEGVDIVHAQSVGGAWIAKMAAAGAPGWLVTTLLDVPASGLRGYWAGALARGDWVITPSNFAAAPVMTRYKIP